MVTVQGFDVFIDNEGYIIIYQGHLIAESQCPEPLVRLTKHDVAMLISILPKLLKQDVGKK